MNHEDIDRSDVLDRYTRGELSAVERDEFEAHYFGCDVCFERVQDTARLKSAVRIAVDDAWLAGSARGMSSPVPTKWAWVPVAASLLLVTAFGWLALLRMPQLQKDLSAARAERDALVARAEPVAPAAKAQPEVNVPVVILQAERGAAAPALLTVASASHVLLWIDAPGVADGAGLTVRSSDGVDRLQLSSLRKNNEGAFVASIPSTALPPDTYRVRLMRSSAPGAPLAAEYLLRVILGP
jgi:hypothetical protein